MFQITKDFNTKSTRPRSMKVLQTKFYNMRKLIKKLEHNKHDTNFYRKKSKKKFSNDELVVIKHIFF